MRLQGKGKESFRPMGVALAFAALALLVATPALPWATLKGETSIGGVVNVTLDADISEYGINYHADLGTDPGSLLSGLGSRLPSGLSGNRVFLTGLGEFQETIGFVKGTLKEKSIKMNSYLPPPQNGTADTRITTMVKTIPWWPVGLEQDIGIKVELTGAENISELKVQKVRFELQRTVAKQQGNQTVNETLKKTVWESSPGDSLKKVQDEVTYWGKAAVDDDYGEFSVVGYVELELINSFGQSNRKLEGGYHETNPGAREIKLWTMSTERTVKIALMVAAFPITVTGAILLAMGAVLALAGKRRERAGRWAWKVTVAGSILAILAVLFYVLGIYALVELTGYLSWFAWGPVFYVALTGACLSVIPAILFILVRPPPAPRPEKEEKGGREKTGGAGTPSGTGRPTGEKARETAGEKGRGMDGKAEDGKGDGTNEDQTAEKGAPKAPPVAPTHQ